MATCRGPVIGLENESQLHINTLVLIVLPCRNSYVTCVEIQGVSRELQMFSVKFQTISVGLGLGFGGFQEVTGSFSRVDWKATRVSWSFINGV